MLIYHNLYITNLYSDTLKAYRVHHMGCSSLACDTRPCEINISSVNEFSNGPNGENLFHLKCMEKGEKQKKRGANRSRHFLPKVL